MAGTAADRPTGRRYGRWTAWDLARIAAITWLVPIVWLTAMTVVPMAFGWRPVLITTGSMVPALYPGSVVLVSDGIAGMRPGMIVDVRPEDPRSPDLVHRLVRVEPGGLILRGDANRTEDPVPVPVERVRGLVRLVVPAAGRAPLALHRHRPDDLLWLFLMVAAVAVLSMAPSSRRRRNG